MKKITALICLLCLPVIATATDIASSDSDAMVHAARVTKVLHLGTIEDIEARLVVTDLGGSTDISPSQKLHFTLYRKGEMFNTDAAFDLGDYLKLTTAESISTGIFKLSMENLDDKNGAMRKETYTLNAEEAIRALQKVDCGEEFDCDAATGFKASITFNKEG